MKQLVLQCSIYWHVPDNTTADEALAEITNYLSDYDLDYEVHDAAFMSECGMLLEEIE